MFRLTHWVAAQVRRWRLSLFEKVILANSLMLVGGAVAGLWITSHNLEAHHYLIDTGFIVAATLLGLLINVLLLRASFRPLFSLLSTIRAVSGGKTDERARISQSDAEVSELARAFNGMLDRLEAIRREQGVLVLRAQEEERRRLALELHDESSQNLTALLIHIEILSQSLQALPDSSVAGDARKQMEEELQYLAGLSQRTLENIRTLAQELRPGALDDLGLHAAFRWLTEDARQRLHLDVELRIEATEPIEDGSRRCKQPTLYETALFRIAQESLTNVARHARARHACMLLTQEQDVIGLQVRDDGRGFDPSLRHAGLGIFGMRERASLLGGTVEIQSEPGQGTTVRARLPLPVENEGVHD